MRRRPLYLEERIGRVRRALNERTVRFADLLPEHDDRVKFHELIMCCLAVLGGEAIELDDFPK